MSVELKRSRIDRAEWVWLAAMSTAILLLSSLPYFVGYRSETGGLLFSGAVVDRMDYSVHLATMHQGERGEWRYRLRFTGEMQQGAFVKSGYIFLGHLARWLRVSLPASYHLGRVFFGLLVCVLVYELAARLFEESVWRRLGWLLAVAGGGLGWLQSMLGWVPQPDLSPVDFWLVDAYTFFGMVAFPHFMAVAALVVWIILVGLDYLHRPANWQWIAAVVPAVLMQFIQPYAPLLADLALVGAFGLHALRNPHRRLKSGLFLASFGLLQLPVLLYNLTAFSVDSGWSSFTQQNITLSPPPVYYAWGFAPYWIPALAGGLWLVRRTVAARAQVEQADRFQEDGAHLALAAVFTWCVGAMLLAYAPTSLQRRFLLVYTLPLGLLAAWGLRHVFLSWLNARGPEWLRRRPMLAPTLVAALACIYAPVLALGQSLYVATRPAELFDPYAWVQAVDWLKANAGENDLVLATEQLSRLTAARAGLPVFFGHPMETLRYAEKSQQVLDYYSGNANQEWLFQTGVRWIMFTETDRYPQEQISRLRPAYDYLGVKIYEVQP
jgi:hypothetical protein